MNIALISPYEPPYCGPHCGCKDGISAHCYDCHVQRPHGNADIVNRVQVDPASDLWLPVWAPR